MTEQPRLARQLLIGGLNFMVFTTVIFGGLTFLMFYLGGWWRIPGWIIVVIWGVFFWRGIRQIIRLSRGDLSL